MSELRGNTLRIRILQIITFYHKGFEISHVRLNNVIKLAGERANICKKRGSPHIFRHFYAVQCILNGIDSYTLSKLLGHSEISTNSVIYTHLKVLNL